MNVSGTDEGSRAWSAPRSPAIPVTPARPPPVPTGNAATIGRRARLGGQLLEQLDTLEKAIKMTAHRRGVGAAGPPVITGDPLELDTATPTRLLSTGAIGASGTSVTPRQPSWQQPANARLSVSGDYDGSDGEGAITFVAEGMPLVPNSSNVRVRAEAPDGSVIGVFDFNRSDRPGTSHSLGNGLRISLEASLIGTYPATGNTARVDVSTGGVNLDNPFDGVGSAGPDFDGGAAVTAGVFTLDGTIVNVLADDSVNDVLARIGASGAGVSATFDVASERIEIVRDAAGASPDIVLSNDSSGFLEAVGLASATSTTGRNGGMDRPIAGVVSLATASSGSLVVNGTSIPIDVGTDSLRDVIEAIDAAGAGVTASLESSNGRFAIRFAGSTPQITLVDGGTGFFAALGVTGSTFGAAAAGTGGSIGTGVDVQALVGRAIRARSYLAADALEGIHDTFGELFSSDATGTLAPLREAIAQLLDDAADQHGKQRLERLGLEFAAGEEGFFQTGKRARRRFAVAIQSRTETLQHVLLGARGSAKEGLIDELRELVVDHLGRGGTGTRGRFVDRFA